MSRRAFAIVATCAALAAPALAAGPALAASHAAKTPTITVTAIDFKFTLSKSSAPKGACHLPGDEQGQDRARLQDRRQEDGVASAREEGEPHGHLREGREVPVPLHRSRAREAGHEGHLHRHLAVPGETPRPCQVGASRLSPGDLQHTSPVSATVACRSARTRSGSIASPLPKRTQPFPTDRPASRSL